MKISVCDVTVGYMERIIMLARGLQMRNKQVHTQRSSYSLKNAGRHIQQIWGSSAELRNFFQRFPLRVILRAWSESTLKLWSFPIDFKWFLGYFVLKISPLKDVKNGSLRKSMKRRQVTKRKLKHIWYLFLVKSANVHLRIQKWI